MVKKLFLVLLCCVFLVACNNETVELLDFLGPQEGVDYGGEIITAFNQSDKIWAYPDDNSLQSEALYAHIARTEEKLNVEIELSTKGESGFREYFKTVIAAGSADTDLVYKSSGNDLWFLAEAGCLMPITDFPEYIDLSDTDKYGAPGVLEAAMHNGIPYAVQPTYWPGLQGIECFFIAYNTDEFTSNGLTDLHEYYESKTWTWDNFKKTLDSAAPLVNEEEVVFLAHGGYLLNTLFLANGFDYITFVDGVPVMDIASKDAVNAIEFLRELTTLGDKINLNAERWEYTDFTSGNAWTTLATAQSVTTGNIAYGSIPYKIMPFPSGPDIEYGKWAQSVTRIYGLAIPVSAEEPAVVAHVINELCEPMEEFGSSKEGLIQYYKENIFSSELDLEIFFAVENNVRYDYDDTFLIDDYCGTIATNINSYSTSELIQKYKPVVERNFKQYIEPNLKGYMIEHLDIE